MEINLNFLYEERYTVHSSSTFYSYGTCFFFYHLHGNFPVLPQIKWGLGTPNILVDM